ncbi:AzlD domain-containing protein [Gordonia sp. HNM0687]|uniref:AzlD domain-containing protein n=1 Tax=Gordonia mangrovi TaxID=2665643 RepID=A0A6L7GSK5_9ACTN|nr:AzlD domain-containing protein [Gordonia mangrovi]MXP22860.1 AzlD domain-containing protein [Gordonia mangrovi]UVF77168.1 AzlD domain-containing protein [Gordonia mangrovi]
MTTAQLMTGVAVLAVGTYLIRVTGPALRSRYEVSPGAAELMDRAAIVLLVGVALTGAVFAGQEIAGWARPAGVAVGIVAAVWRAPLIVVIVLAAGVTAGLRACGVA